MLLCGVADLKPDMVVGASIIHPQRPDTELLRPGFSLDAATIARMTQMGVHDVWIEHEATTDLDAAVADGISAAQTIILQQLNDDFNGLSARTISTANIQDYRQSITELLCELIGSGKYARLTHQLHASENRLFSHGADVAFISLLVGLELEHYIIDQRRRPTAQQARDLVPLGLGAMLHDIGKTVLDAEHRQCHEIDLHPDAPQDGNAYFDHVRGGYEMLANARVPATARHVVLTHHQRYDGGGWPNMATVSDSRQLGSQRGNEIHIFSRIVAAANVLDNLMHDADGNPRPAVAGLKDFTEKRFDGWFDPVVHDLMIRRLPPFPIGSLVTLSDGQQAVVIVPSMDQPCRPRIRTLQDSSKRDGQPTMIDLGERPDLHIVRCAGEPTEDHLFELTSCPIDRSQGEAPRQHRKSA